MGSSSSKSSKAPNRSRELVLYDNRRAAEAVSHHQTDFVDPRSLVNSLRSGDLVQVKGNYVHQWFYSHFAVYYGNGDIIHVIKSGGEYKVLKEKMEEAFKGRLVRKNNHMDNTSHFQARSPREVANTARSKIGEDWDYNFFTNNCEHFATLCRYGRKVSLQTSGIADVISGNISASELAEHICRSVVEKAKTLKSWINRKVFGFFDKARQLLSLEY